MIQNADKQAAEVEVDSAVMLGPDFGFGAGWAEGEIDSDESRGFPPR